MKKILQLEIGFENCETLNIGANDVASISIQNITKNVYKDWYTDNIKVVRKALDITIILTPDANKGYNGQQNIKTTFERISKFNDITDITAIFNNGDVENIAVLWNEDDSYSNKYQTSAALSDGSLVIAIGEKENAEQIKEEFNHKIEQIDKYNKSLRESIDKTHGRWVKVYGFMAAGGDPVYRCSSCGLDEHVYGIEHHEKHVKCNNCGSINIYPWEKRNDIEER